MAGGPVGFTAERLRAELSGAGHRARYAWASGLCDGRRVLDAGCGEGDGTAMLAAAGATTVVGVDISETALELARRRVGDDVDLRCCDLVEMTDADASFDLIVGFGLDRLAGDIERMLDTFTRLLDDGGLLLCSTACDDSSRSNRGPAQRLETLLEARFTQCRIIPQRSLLASVVNSASLGCTPSPAVSWESTAPGDGHDETILAIAGTRVPDATAPAIALATTVQPQRWLEAMQDAERHDVELREVITELSGRQAQWRQALIALAEAESRIAVVAETEGDLAEKRRELEITTAALSERTQQLADAQAELEQLRTMTTSLCWRLAAALRRLVSARRR